MIDTRLSRRELLQRGGLAGGALLLSGAFPFPLAARAAAESATPTSLTLAEWKTLDAITARLIPGDDDPGAREAGCVNFIDKVLAHEEQAALPLYRAGLAAIDALAQARGGQGFAALATSAQDEVLVAIEVGNAKAWPAQAPASPLFFETVRVHTLFGFLADPKYGGNRGFAGWQVVGYPGARHHEGGYTPEQMRGEASIPKPWDK